MEQCLSGVSRDSRAAGALPVALERTYVPTYASLPSLAPRVTFALHGDALPWAFRLELGEETGQSCYKMDIGVGHAVNYIYIGTQEGAYSRFSHDD